MTKALAFLLIVVLANTFILDIITRDPLALALHLSAFYVGTYMVRAFPWQ